MPRFRKTNEEQIGYEDLARRVAASDHGFPRYSGMWHALVGLLSLAPGTWGVPNRCGQGAAQLAIYHPDLVERQSRVQRGNGTTVYEYRLTPAGREIAERLENDPS